MATENLTLYEIRTIGVDALVRELVPSGTIRFVHRYMSILSFYPSRNYPCLQENLQNSRKCRNIFK